MAKLRKFKLLPGVGSHAGPGKQDKSVHVKSGDIVESEHDLVILFPGKWEEVGLPKSKKQIDDEERQPIREDQKVQGKPPESREEAASEEDAGADSSGDVESPFGTNVTAKFTEFMKSEKAKGFLVWKNKRKKGSDSITYTITHTETPEIAENEDPFTFKDVKKLLKSYQD